MIKTPRFMIEYANSKIDATWNNELMQEQYKNDIIRKIDRTVHAYATGQLTVDEAMQLISEA